MKITPHFEFNKYDFGFGIAIKRSNESKKYFRECRTINYLFGIVFLWFSFGLEIKIIGDDKNEK